MMKIAMQRCQLRTFILNGFIGKLICLLLSQLLFFSNFPASLFTWHQVNLTSIASARESTLQRARSDFFQGDIVAARNLLSREVGMLPSAEQPEAFLLLGVCQYLTGRKAAAQDAFLAALRLNRRIQIPRNYLLDPGILNFYKGVQAQSQRSTRQGSESGSQMKSLSARPIESSQSVPHHATGITVTTNTGKATIFANGFFVGKEATFIELSPGRFKITASAEGFNPTSQLVTLSKGQRLKLTLELTDPAEIERQRQLARARQRLLAEQEMKRKLQEALAARQRARQIAERKKRERELELLARQKAELEKRKLEQALRAEEERIAKEKLRQRQEAERLALELKRMQIEKLQREVAAAEGRSPPSLPSPSVRSEPRPQKSVSRQMKPASSRPSFQEQLRYQPTQKARNRPSKSSSKSTFLAILPFGIGQFQNDDYTLGTLTALAQVGTLGFGIFKFAETSSFEQTFQADVATNGDELDSTYIDESRVYIEEQYSLAQVMLLAFGGIWAVSAVEALVSINSSTSTASLNHSNPTSLAGGRLGTNPAVTNSSLHLEPKRTLSFNPIAQFNEGRYGFSLQLRY